VRMWSLAMLLALPWQLFASGPASDRTEILRDELSIRLRNTKPQFLSVFVERRQVIHFASHDDLVAHGRFILPESLDPVYDRSLVPWNSGPARPRWVNVRMDHFSAHKIHPDGSREELPVFSSLGRRELRNLRTYDVTEDHIHDVQGLEPGDVLEVHWKYMIPYDSNWPNTMGWRNTELRWMDNWARLTNWRVFMHGVLPVKEQRIELLYDRRHGLVLGGERPSERIGNGNELVRVWNSSDLPACMNEPNARPARDLPHITILFVPEDPRYWRRDRLSGLPFEQPHWLQVVRLREEKAFWWRRVARERVPNRQNQLMREYIHRIAGHLPPDDRAGRMKAVHEQISQHFTYDRDDLWYRDVDMSTERLGDQMRELRIRDISRYNMYAKLLGLLGLDHSTAYLMDDRVGRMDDRFLSPMWDSEFLFAVRNGQELIWMHPKRSEYGLMTNELPFYWQGTGALLVDLDLLLDDVPPPPLFVELPSCEAHENVRGTEYDIEVDLDAGTMQAGTRVFLSGQYSTLGRAAYLGFPIDSTVDPLYGRRAYDLPEATILHWKNRDVEQDRPFRFRADGRLHVAGGIAANDHEVFVEITPFFKHVLPPPFDPGHRVLPWQWDFPGSDHYKIELKFDRPVELLNAEDLHLQVSTSSSSYARRIRVIAPDHIVIQTDLKVNRAWEYAPEMERLATLIEEAQKEMIIRLRPAHLEEEGRLLEH
jgi:hypothetical protein